MKKKSNAFDTFKKWKAMVETKTGLKLKFLNSDNGDEYIAREFKEYCVANGIKRKNIIPETPQHRTKP